MTLPPAMPRKLCATNRTSVLRRTYRFEFSETRSTRIEGRMILSGYKIESVMMNPNQIIMSRAGGLYPAAILG
jgi:hypothetical protein